MAAPPQRIETLRIGGPLRRADLPGLLARSCALLAGARGCVLRCELTAVACDAVAVDALARLALSARRGGSEVRLCEASEELVELIELMGLTDVLRA
jgi:ABC-type transporter Mla MlaB component